MRLKVNQDKSAVARPEKRHFVGFSLRREPQEGTIVFKECGLVSVEETWRKLRIQHALASAQLALPLG